MAKTYRVPPGEFAIAVEKALGDIGGKTLEIADKSAKTAARQAASDLKSSSPVGATGKYARGWARKTQKTTGFGTAQVVYNRSDGQLTHLLEKPHETGGGGHYPKRKDHTGIIADVEEKYTQQFMEEVLAKL